MYQNISNTRFVLDGYAMNNNKYNVESLTDQVYIYAINTRNTYELLKNTKIKNNNVALQWMLAWLNSEFKYLGIKAGCYATIKQLQSIEKNHPELITVIDNLKDLVINERNEMNIKTK